MDSFPCSDCYSPAPSGSSQTSIPVDHTRSIEEKDNTGFFQDALYASETGNEVS
jgi:hypothetical protein